MSNYITTEFLNLRKAPIIASGNILGVMPPDTVVEPLNGEDVPGWVHVRTILGKAPVEGYASQKYLQLSDLGLPAIEPALAVPAVHYPSGNRKVSRKASGLWVYPLNEPGLIKADLHTINNAEERCAMIHNVIDYLDVENSIRYAPNSKSTYCNIYAYDVSYCLGAYLPRVWWTAEAITRLKQGETLTPRYDVNVTEYTANLICNWLEQYGTGFGWQRSFNLTELQDSVNKGMLGIIVGQRVNMNNAGHIVAVVPETSSHAARRSHGALQSPLQSQAGSKNKKFYSGYNWWEDQLRFKKFGFWVWAP